LTEELRNEINPANAPPSVPTGLEARREGTTVIFSWDASSDDRTPTPGLTYNLRVGSLPGANDVVPAMALPSGRRLVPGRGNAGHNLSWAVRGLPEGTYYWSVQALDGSQQASAFAEEQLVTGDPDDTTPPAPPSGFAAEASDARVDLAWSANTEDDLARYRLYRGPTPDAVEPLVTLLADRLAFTDTTVTNGTTYYYRLSALDATGNESALTDAATATPRALFVPVDAGLPALYRGDADWADYDGDGDLDLVLTGATEPSDDSQGLTRLYRNDGGTLTDVGAELPALARSTAAWGDYDGDGDPDLLLAGRRTDGDAPPRFTRLYRNDGGTFVGLDVGFTGVRDGDADWADYDGDGDLDLVLAGDGPSDTVTQIYRNDGGGAFTRLTPDDTGNELPGVSSGSVAWGDYNGDGEPELLLAGNFSGFLLVRVYRNNAGFFSDIGAGLTGIVDGEARWADWDGDGDLDIAVTGRDGTDNGTRQTALYRNDLGEGGGFTRVEADLAGGNALAWGDADGDGDPDLAVASAEGSRVYRNDGGAFVDLRASTLPAAGEALVTWADVDGDGAPDLLFAGSGSDQLLTRLLRNGLSTSEGQRVP
ncbi:MAG: hypothetical protein GVY18_07495, partial [Bacteroidetes bacterium]|nr:hypothetical protein [Bacteroidota bacterium]